MTASTLKPSTGPLREAVAHAVASVHPIAPTDESKVRELTSEGQQILAAVQQIVDSCADEFDKIQKKLDGTQAELASTRIELIAVRTENAHLHECVERLIRTVQKADENSVNAARAHATSMIHMNDALAGLRTEVGVLGEAAAGARTEAIHAADRAEAAERYVHDATRQVRSERATEPSLPCARDTEVRGSEFVLPMDHFPKFESSAPPPGQGED